MKMIKMDDLYRYFLLFFVFVFCGVNVISQNQETYFKTLPPLTEDTPNWAVLMYSEDPNVYEVYEAYDLYHRENEFVKTTHTQNYKYWVRQVAPHLDINGLIRPIEENQTGKNSKKGQKQGGTNLDKNITNTWQAIGPFETYREGVVASWQAYVGCMDVCRSNPNIAYAGSFSIYKTTDKGNTWFPITYDLPVRGITAVAVAPNNCDIVYFATNSELWKSTDGSNFEMILSGITGCNKILIHPTNNNIVMLGSNEGIERSTDGGVTWTSILTETCWDIDFHPTNPSIVYTVVNNPTAIKSEFWKSTDTGASFTLQSNGWYNSTDPNRTDGGSRIAVTPAAPDRVYVGLVGFSKAGDNNWIGVYRSDNAGASWYNPSGQDGGPYAAANSASPWNIAAYGGDQGVQQGFYNFDIAASHNNADKLWVGTVRLAESSNGGQSFISIGGPESQRHTMHADIQEIVVVGSDIWVANDGGIDYSNNELLGHSSKKYGINGADFWGYSSGKNLDVMVGGTYHNGNSARHPNYTSKDFQYLGGSESPTGYVDGADNTKLYCSDIWSCIISTSANVPRTWLYSFLDKYPNEAYVKSQSSEIVYDVNTPTTCYLGRDAIFYRSTNSGANASPIFTFNGGNGKVFEIEQSQQNANKFYLVFHNYSNANSERGEIYKSTDGGNSWNKVTDIPAANHPYLEISLNPNNDEELWVGNSSGGSGEKVYRTINGGSSWTNETTALIDYIDLHDIIYISSTGSNNKDRVYIVGDGEVHLKNVNDTEWIDVSNGMPAAFLPNRFGYFPNQQLLRIATRGHGIWELDVSQPCNIVTSLEEFTVCSSDKKYIGVEVDGTDDYNLSWTDNGAVVLGCSEIIGEGNNLTLDGGDQLISNFCNGTGGIYYVDLELITSCYNTEASFKAIVNTNTNTINVLEYIHFAEDYSSDMIGEGTNSVTSSSSAYAQIEIGVSGTSLYLDVENMPCGPTAIVRVQNGNIHPVREVTTAGTYTFNISSGANCNGTESIDITNPNALTISTTDMTTCANPAYTGVEVDGTAFYEIDWTGGNDNINPCSEMLTENIGNNLEVSGGNLLVSDFCGNTQGEYYVELILFSSCYSVEASFKGKIDLNNDIIEVIEYIHFNEPTPSNMPGDGTATVTSSSAAFAEFELILSNKQLYLNHTIQPCGTGYIQLIDGFTRSYTCPLIIPEGENLTLDGGDLFITELCNLTDVHYVDLEFITNCYNAEASFKAIVNTNTGTIDVLEYMHFAESTSSDMTGDGTASVISVNNAFAQIEVFLSDNSLYLDAENMPCGPNSVVRVLNGNTHAAYPVNTTGTYPVTVISDDRCSKEEEVNINILSACDDNDACTIGDVYDADCNCMGTLLDTNNNDTCDVNENTSFQLKVFLQGALLNSGGDWMRDDLRANNYIPTTEPYSTSTYFTHYGTGGGETINANMLTDKGDSSIVDWILVELRDANDPTIIIETQSVLLQKDGAVIDINESKVLTFESSYQDYHVAIRHRNHLGVMTANPLTLDANTLIDFTDINTPTWGINACVNMGNNTQALWAGNGVVDDRIIFQGGSNDVNMSFFTVLQASTNTNLIPNFIEMGYQAGDIDMNGQCIFQGANNESNFIFFNVLSFPDNINGVTNYIIQEQLP